MISVTAQLAAHAEENTALLQPQQRKLQLGAEAAHLNLTEDGAAAYLQTKAAEWWVYCRTPASTVGVLAL